MLQYLTNQRYKPESLYSRWCHSSNVCQLTSEDMAGSSCGVARDQRLWEKDGDETKSQDSHHKLYKVGVRCMSWLQWDIPTSAWLFFFIFCIHMYIYFKSTVEKADLLHYTNKAQ